MKGKTKVISWHDAPPPFNQDARPGLGPAVSREYFRWCKENPSSTQEQRKGIYATIHGRLQPSFPSYAEMRR